MEQQMKTVQCSACGAALQIPAELTEYSCMYCGNRIREEAAPQGDLQEVLPKLIDCVKNYRGFQQRITRDFFAAAFEEYEAGCADIFRALDRAAAGSAESCAEAAAERLLDDLNALWEQSPDWQSRQKRTLLLNNDKLIVAIFLVPMVRRLKLPVSEPFCTALQKKWVARYPKDPFYIGDYESIEEGFHHKFLGLCFITTAVCRASGLPDDCAELTAFRRFRDGYLRACPDGAALIDEYYNIAPGIVTCIDLCSDSAARYAAIRRQYLQPCYADLQNGRLEACKARYVQMVRDLQKEYLS